MTYIETALDAGLTPRKLEHLIRGHASVGDIAAAYQTDVLTVQLLMRRWGLEHLSGRAKQNVVLLVREAQQ